PAPVELVQDNCLGGVGLHSDPGHVSAKAKGSTSSSAAPMGANMGARNFCLKQPCDCGKTKPRHRHRQPLILVAAEFVSQTVPGGRQLSMGYFVEQTGQDPFREDRLFVVGDILGEKVVHALAEATFNMDSA